MQKRSAQKIRPNKRFRRDTRMYHLMLLVPVDLLLLIIHPIAAARQYRRARRKCSRR